MNDAGEDKSIDSMRKQVRRITENPIFQRSCAQRMLLSYLLERTLSGTANQLKEYTIGVEALGKSSSYDPRQDSIVRYQICRIRQKLLEYYLTDGKEDPIIIELPKGAFALRCTQRNREEPVSDAIASKPSLSVQQGLTISQADDSWNDDLQELWSPFWDSNRPVLIVVGMPLFFRYPTFGFCRDISVNEWEHVEKSESLSSIEDALRDHDGMPWQTFAGIGDLYATFLLTRSLAPRIKNLAITRSSHISWREIADSNLICLGPTKFFPHLELIRIKRAISMEEKGIRNLFPAAGEKVYLADQMPASTHEDGFTYVLISLIPGVQGNGSILHFAGNQTPASIAAAQWYTDPAHASALASQLRLPSGKLPQHYQIALKTQFKDGIPIETSYLFHRNLAQVGDLRSENGYLKPCKDREPSDHNAKILKIGRRKDLAS